MLQHPDSKQPALINPIVLQWARKTLGLSESEAAQKLRVSVEKLIAWESGVEVVPVKKLHVLAKVYKRPSAVFLFDEEPSGDIPASFRRLFDFYANEFTQDTILAIRKAIRTQETVKEIFGDNENKFMAELVKLRKAGTYEQVAQKIYKLFEIDINDVLVHRTPFEQLNFWKDTIESKGVYVLEMGFPIQEAKGFAVYDRSVPIIVLNTKDFPNARIFTILHELAHFIYGKGSVITPEHGLNTEPDDVLERACNDIAGSILVPSAVLEEKIEQLRLDTNNLKTTVEILAGVFNVSRDVILYRLYKTGFISQKQFKDYWNESRIRQDDAQRKVPGGDFYIRYLKNNSRYFVTRILDAYHDSRITYNDTLDYLGVKAETLSKLESRV